MKRVRIFCRALWRGFRAVTSRVIIRLLRATVRWKVETRSFPTRRWNPFSDLYIQSYDLYHPEKKYYVWANLTRVEPRHSDLQKKTYLRAGFQLS